MHTKDDIKTFTLLLEAKMTQNSYLSKVHYKTNHLGNVERMKEDSYNSNEGFFIS